MSETIEMNPLLARAISNMDVPIVPVGNGYGWQITTVKDDNGKEHVFGVLSISNGNGIDLYWFPVEGILQFAENVQQVAQAAVMEHRKINPLIVASSVEANNIAKQGFGTNRQNIEWPQT